MTDGKGLRSSLRGFTGDGEGAMRGGFWILDMLDMEGQSR